MNQHVLTLFLKDGEIAAEVVENGRTTGRRRFPLEASCPEGLVEMARGVSLAICPGGCLRPLKAGTYPINEAVLSDLRTGEFGSAPYDLITALCGQVGKELGVPAYFTEAMSVDELLPQNRIRSHAQVPKYSRGFRAEHLAAMEKAAGERPENGNYIAVYLDDLVSVGAYSRGRCLDVNDCIGAEGPMGFTSSGDVPCAQLADYFSKGEQTFGEMQDLLLHRSGMLQYTGTDDPLELDARCKEDPAAAAAAGGMVYQIAKWIGSAALALRGDVQKIVVTGKGVRSVCLMDGLREKVGGVAPLELVEDPELGSWLARKAELLGSFAEPVNRY